MALGLLPEAGADCFRPRESSEARKEAHRRRVPSERVEGQGNDQTIRCRACASCGRGPDQ